MNSEQLNTKEQGPTSASTRRLGSGLVKLLRRHVWLEEEIARAVNASFREGKPGWDEFRYGAAAVDDADQLAESEQGLYSGVLLARAGLLLLIRAHGIRLGIDDPTLLVESCWAQLLERDEWAWFKGNLSELQRTLMAVALGERAETALIRQSNEEARSTLAAMLLAARELQAPLLAEAQGVRSALVWRWVRVSLLLALVAVVSTSVWQKLNQHPNLAFGKRVTVEKSHSQWGRDPKGLVDGKKDEIGFHTIEAPNQYVTIDLGSNFRISRVVVFNRTECCQDRATPLRIDVSEDGTQFRKVAQRDEPFQTDWTAEFPRTKARYVRLTDLSSAAFHLAEVEIY